MEYTLSTHLLVYEALRDPALAALSASGYSKLELWLAAPHVPWNEDRPLREFAARLQDHGLEAASVHLPFYPSVPKLLEEGARWSLIDPARADRAEALSAASDGLFAAAALGADRGVLHLGWQKDAWDGHSHEWAREAVRELIPVAREAGVKLLLENIISSGTRVAKLMELLEEVDPQREVGLCVDLGHAHVEGNILEELALALPRLDHLHMHDNDGTQDSHLAPGQGTIPWGEVYRMLESAGFDGHAALELRDPSKGTAGCAHTLQHAVQEVHGFRQRMEKGE